MSMMTEQQATEGSINGTTTATLHESDATVEVVLSRPAYRLGGSVVGTIRLVGKQDVDPRAWFQSAEVYVAGRCKVDDRWHNPGIYKKLYGVHPHLKECVEVESKVCLAEDTVCFWATNMLDLLELEERTVGRWEDVNPRALVENSGLLHDCEAAAYEDNPTEGSTQDELPLESKQLAFTFRADLPLDIPHSAVATCVRYSYSVVVSVKTTTNELLVVNAPFSVLTPLTGNALMEKDLAKAPRVRLGTCTAMAHSSGLPCHVTAADLHRPKGATTVNRNANLLATVSSGNVQTLRIADPDGEPCCILTALGSQVINPGGHLLLQFDFPSSWVPCHQVSACLQGEEIALYEDGSTNKTRTLLLDTAYEMVETGFTERASLSLYLPLDCPCTVLTDLVKMTVQCRIDLACEKVDGGYSNLQFHLPLKVAHSPIADEVNGTDFGDEDVNSAPLDEIVFGAETLSLIEKDTTKPSSFVTKDIRKDLKILSLRMVESCGLET